MVEIWDILDKNSNVTGRVHERDKPMNKGEFHLRFMFGLRTTTVKPQRITQIVDRTPPVLRYCSDGYVFVKG